MYLEFRFGVLTTYFLPLQIWWQGLGYPTMHFLSPNIPWGVALGQGGREEGTQGQKEAPTRKAVVRCWAGCSGMEWRGELDLVEGNNQSPGDGEGWRRRDGSWRSGASAVNKEQKQNIVQWNSTLLVQFVPHPILFVPEKWAKLIYTQFLLWGEETDIYAD